MTPHPVLDAGRLPGRTGIPSRIVSDRIGEPFFLPRLSPKDLRMYGPGLMFFPSFRAEGNGLGT